MSLSKGIRQRVLHRDGHCRACGSTSRLEVHHLVERAGGGADRDDNLVTLCGLCHLGGAHDHAAVSLFLTEDEPALEFRTGDDGLALLVLQLPRPTRPR